MSCTIGACWPLGDVIVDKIEAEDTLGFKAKLSFPLFGTSSYLAAHHAGLVAEVTFGQLEGGRFRHGVKFQCWRPDRTPDSCRYEQLDVAEAVRFNDLLAESG